MNKQPSPPDQPSPLSLSMSSDEVLLPPSPGKFDALTPSIAYELSGGQQPESVYGDRPESVLEEQPEAQIQIQTEPEQSRENSRDGMGSGSESELALSGEDKVENGDREDDVSSTSGIETDKDSDDDSDDENIPEPKLSEVEMSKVPELNLRPEQVDNLNILIYPKGDRRKYDFDIHNVIIPEYEFADPLSEDTRDIDLLLVANSGHDWRDYAVKDPEDEMECKVIDRLIELEKLRKQTIEIEKGRREQMRKEKERAQARSRLGGARIQCARVWREKKCCLDCLQVCCVGDCNEHKKYSDTLCFNCDENHKGGTCNEKVYDTRSRGQETEEKDKDNRPKTPSSLKRPGSCPSCQNQKLNTAKYINANNVVLGRPKSGNATFARGQGSSKPTDLRGTSVGPALEKEFDGLGLEPTKSQTTVTEPPPERPNTACSDRQRHFRGRVGVVPGKSYFSQRRMSLTDAVTRERIKSAGSVRKKRSSRKKRPKTAVS